MATLGTVLSTVNVVLGPAAGTGAPARSVAVPAIIEIPSVPSPVIPEMVTVRAVAPEVETATVPLAVPVVLSVMSAVARVIALMPLPSVSV